MREYAYEIVCRTLEKGGHSDELFHQIVNKNHIEEHRGFLKRLSYGTIERAIELDAVLNQVSRVPVARMDVPVRTILRMALYELRYMEQIPEAVTCHEAVELTRKKAGEKRTGFVNGVLRTCLREKDKLVVSKLWQRLSLPEDLMNAMILWYGKKTAERIGRYFLEKQGKTTIHVNVNKIAVEEYEKRLDQRKIVWNPGIYHADACILEGAEDVRQLPGYADGYFFVQDESSMFPVCCADIQRGDQVVDVCSAPGGKTLHALMSLAGTGFVSARDVSEKKTEKIVENTTRMGYGSDRVEVKVFDGTKEDDLWRERADVILADVPCSGIGIIGRKPEIKYHALDHAKELVKIQRQICASAVRMLRPGGTFIYSTCTINPEENIENIRWMEEHLGLLPESIDPWIPMELRSRMTERGMLQMLPGIQESDGFFVARLKKRQV